MEDILRTLVSYKTTRDNPEEIKKAFEYIASLFDPTIFEVNTIEHNGVYSQLISFKGNDALHPRILLNGHLDVVPAENEEQYDIRIEGSRIFGRGTADMKGMIAVLIEGMRECISGTSIPDVTLLLTADEEIGGENGAGYVAREKGLKPQFVLCADGTHDQREIVVKEKGGLWLEILGEGKTAHGAYLWKGENALEKVLAAVNIVKGFVGPTQPEAWKSTCNVAIIETSNTTPNKVPADARAVLDIRFTEELAKTPEELFKKIQRLIPKVKIRPLTHVSLLLTDEKSLFLQKFKSIADDVSKEDTPLHFGHGATDARYFAEMGVPAVVFGAKGGNWHASQEWVDFKSLQEAKEILTRFLASV